jgi:hypothetical protein
LHPDCAGLSNDYQSGVGACFADWGKLDDRGQKLKLMIEAWQIIAFYKVPVVIVRDGLMVIPEYRDMLARDYLRRQFQNERGN